MKLLITLSLISTSLFAQQKDSIAFLYANQISIEQLKTHLTILASNAFEGRETGEKGQKMAAAYLVSQFKKSGIKAYKDTTYYQEYELKKGIKKQPLFYRLFHKKRGPVMAENVLAYIEGSDLKNEVVVISGHYDHLGIRDKKIYNGADDNGSGTTALIELARIFAQAKKDGHGPRRSILIIAFSGEEKGLLGSEYYANNPIFPLANTVCDLNIDMIGRIDEKHTTGDYVYLIGSDKLSSQLHALSDSINTTYTQLELDYTFNDKNDKNRFYYRSDHYNFAKNGIPVIFYFNGVHADYHEPTDDVEKINFDKIKKISQFVFLTAWEIANKDERLVVDSNKE
jgi:Zn-dependent M28 family amino/carboxypeptidase